MIHNDLVNAALLTLSPLGFAWKNNTGATKNPTGQLVRYGLPGSSDVLACIKGRFVGVECKVGRDRLRDNQVRFSNMIRRNGGVIILLHAGPAEDPIEAASRLIPLLAAEGLA